MNRTEILHRSIRAGVTKSAANQMAARLPNRALVPVEIHDDAAIESLIRPKKGAQS